MLCLFLSFNKVRSQRKYNVFFCLFFSCNLIIFFYSSAKKYFFSKRPKPVFFSFHPCYMFCKFHSIFIIVKWGRRRKRTVTFKPFHLFFLVLSINALQFCLGFRADRTLALESAFDAKPMKEPLYFLPNHLYFFDEKILSVVLVLFFHFIYFFFQQPC